MQQGSERSDSYVTRAARLFSDANSVQSEAGSVYVCVTTTACHRDEHQHVIIIVIWLRKNNIHERGYCDQESVVLTQLLSLLSTL